MQVKNMAPNIKHDKTVNKTIKKHQHSKWNVLKLIKKYFTLDVIVNLLTNPRYTMPIGWTLILIELVLNLFVVEYVSYTEIDWNAYMQECEGFLNGTWNYTELKGDTGPLVYPAGFTYLYSLLYLITSEGKNILLAQYIFIFVYLMQLYMTLRIYARTRKIPPYALILTTLTSYRIHSIYVLRLFNDPFAVLLFYTALNCFLYGKWFLGSTLYSLAVSIKMNILLYAPCLLLGYIACCGGAKGAILHILWCALVQLILGLPFLYGNYWGYIAASFNLGRIFEHKWTVNYRFLDQHIFENGYFHLGLLCLHLIVLTLFLPSMWKFLTSYAKLKQIETQLQPQLDDDMKRRKTKNEKEEKKKDVSPIAVKDPIAPCQLSKDQQRFVDAYETALRRRSVDDSQFTVDFSSSAQLIVLPMFVTNLIGIACARSLHYQFYSWYFHSLLYVAWCTHFPKPVIFLLLGIIEFCWNTYPSTNLSSILLHVCHITLLLGVYRIMRKSATNNCYQENEETNKKLKFI